LFIAQLGEAAVAAHQITFNLWDVFYIPMVSIGSAMATRMGHAIGAGNTEGVRMALRVGATLSALVGLVTMALLLLFPMRLSVPTRSRLMSETLRCAYCA
jgi:MATE family multidrug resistance protein